MQNLNNVKILNEAQINDAVLIKKVRLANKWYEVFTKKMCNLRIYIHSYFRSRKSQLQPSDMLTISFRLVTST
jgi:hypothetical protein